MNINGITNASRTNPCNTHNKTKASSSFGDMLSEVASTAKTPQAAPKARTLTEAANEAIANAPSGAIQVFLPNDKTVCSYGYGTDQYVYAEYTEDSTAEDPIVRIYCRAKSGTYEYTCHLNDVDPENATYAELCALGGHQMKLKNPDAIGGPAVPTGYEIGDMMSKQNFLTGLEGLSNSKMFSQGILTDAKEFLQFYAGLIEEKKQQLEEATEFDTLMNAVDNVIEGRAPMEPKEVLERLSEPAKDTLEDMKSGEDISKSEWTDFCKELQDIGAITEDEFNSVRADIQLVPAGYELHPVMVRELRAMYARSQGIYVDTEMWTGNPFEYLTSWAALMDDWKDMLTTLKNPDGTVKYTDFSPIDDQIEACRSVSDIVNGLLEQFE